MSLQATGCKSKAGHFGATSSTSKEASTPQEAPMPEIVNTDIFVHRQNWNLDCSTYSVAGHCGRITRSVAARKHAQNTAPSLWKDSLCSMLQIPLGGCRHWGHNLDHRLPDYQQRRPKEEPKAQEQLLLAMAGGAAMAAGPTAARPTAVGAPGSPGG